MRQSETGVVLVGVLALLGLASALVYMMLGPGEVSIARSQRFAEAGQALALLRAGEQSAAAALRRDKIEAPDLDHAGEAWSAIAQADIEIAGGAFALAIADAQDRLDLNALAIAEMEDLQVLMTVGAAAGLPPEKVAAIASTLADDGPLEAMADLAAQAGLSEEELAALGRLADALPAGGPVNINVAPVEVVAAILRDPARARLLVSARDRAGFLAPADVERLGVVLPPGIGLQSDLFRVRTSVLIGETLQAAESLLRRQASEDGPEVVVIRRRSLSAPAALPPAPAP